MELHLLQKTKERMKQSKVFQDMVVTGSPREILLDMDGDRLADIGLLDNMGDGNIDTLALDLTGDNEFNLFFSDTDLNGFPDITYLDEKSDGNLQLVGIGEMVQGEMQQAASRVYSTLQDENATDEEIAAALKELDKIIRDAREKFIN